MRFNIILCAIAIALLYTSLYLLTEPESAERSLSHYLQSDTNPTLMPR